MKTKRDKKDAIRELVNVNFGKGIREAEPVKPPEEKKEDPPKDPTTPTVTTSAPPVSAEAPKEPENPEPPKPAPAASAAPTNKPAGTPQAKPDASGMAKEISNLDPSKILTPEDIDGLIKKLQGSAAPATAPVNSSHERKGNKISERQKLHLTIRKILTKED